jgi:hypothetical protein
LFSLFAGWKGEPAARRTGRNVGSSDGGAGERGLYIGKKETFFFFFFCIGMLESL